MYLGCKSINIYNIHIFKRENMLWIPQQFLFLIMIEYLLGDSH